MNSKVEPAHAAWMAKAAGIFSWDIEANRCYGDEVVAMYFDLDVAKAQSGLPLQDYLAAMYSEDRARVARALHHTILSGEPYHEEYRLVHEDGTVIWVLAIGQCFRGEEGSPSNYAGVIYDITEQKTTRTDGISDHCHAALHVAQQLDNDRLVSLLESAIVEAREEDLRGALRASIRH